MDKPIIHPTASQQRENPPVHEIHNNRFESLDRFSLLNASAAIAYLGTLFLLYSGWRNRYEMPIRAEDGVGYWMGITGGIMMLTLLLYPLRKKAKIMHRFGAIKYWFRMHMMLGVMGPLFIIFHSNFQLGSLNSTVAFSMMLLVASSGLVGRYFYTRIHYGLYGRIATLKQLREDNRQTTGKLQQLMRFSPVLMERIEQVSTEIAPEQLHNQVGLLRAMTHHIFIRWYYARLLVAIKLALKHEAHEQEWKAAIRKKLYNQIKKQLALHFSLLRKISELRFYERLFSIWHVFHYPLFLMLVFSGIVHVVAVHAY